MNLLYTNQDYYTYFLIILLYRKLVAAYNDFGRGFIIKINMKTQILQTHTFYIYIYIYTVYFLGSFYIWISCIAPIILM